MAHLNEPHVDHKYDADDGFLFITYRGRVSRKWERRLGKGRKAKDAKKDISDDSKRRKGIRQKHFLVWCRRLMSAWRRHSAE